MTFNQDLQDRVSWTASNWWYQATPAARFAALSVSRPTARVIECSISGSPVPTPGSVGANYDPPPYEVVNAGGDPAAAFYGFPVTVV